MRTADKAVKGDMLVCKDTTHVSRINMSDPKNRKPMGGSEKIPAGAPVLCLGRNDTRRMVQVIYGEGTWEGTWSAFVVAEPSEKLQGKSFCFTGALAHTREYYKALVELHSGTFSSSVSKTLTYLVTEDPKTNSTKGTKARSLGIPVINEKILMGILNA